MISHSENAHRGVFERSKESDQTLANYSPSEESRSTDFEMHGSEAPATSASGATLPDSHTLPRDFAVFREVITGLSRLENRAVREAASRFLLRFQRIVSINRDAIDLSAQPPLRFHVSDDEAVLIEWVFKDFRIGFSIEPQVQESSWYLVSNRNLNEESRSGQLKESEIDTVLLELLAFVARNT